MQKEYEDKLKANLEEIELYKQQLSQTMKETDQKQINSFQKQIADKERQLYLLNAEKLEIEGQMRATQREIQEKEEVIINFKQSID